MTRFKSILTNSLLTLTLCLTIVTMAVVLSDMQPVQADESGEVAVVTVSNNNEYLPLTDAPLQRDISSQRFAPLIGAP
ncbi:MAG: hypothetical protein H6632_13780 [Anaerolineales bacterium]|nr:hypothetical protein [Anaerolineales bacterium]